MEDLGPDIGKVLKVLCYAFCVCYTSIKLAPYEINGRRPISGT